MRKLFVSHFLFAALAVISATTVNEGKEIWCSRANITSIRIHGCSAEPCTLKKGKRLPFEIDFSFQTPQSADEVSMTALAPYWNVPGQGAYGTNLVAKGAGKCADFSSECPAPACTQSPCDDASYTIKSYLFADRRLQRTVGKKEKTGKVNSNWLFTPLRTNGTNDDPVSQCSFNVMFNLVK